MATGDCNPHKPPGGGNNLLRLLHPRIRLANAPRNMSVSTLALEQIPATAFL